MFLERNPSGGYNKSVFVVQSVTGYNYHYLRLCNLPVWFHFNFQTSVKRDKAIFTQTWDSKPATMLKGILAQSADYKRERRIWTVLTGPTKHATIVMRREKMATSMRVWQNLQKTFDRDAPSRPRLFSSSCHKDSSLQQEVGDKMISHELRSQPNFVIFSVNLIYCIDN